MATNPLVLLLVTGVSRSQDIKGVLLRAFDFSQPAGTSATDIPDQVVAITANTRQTIEQPRIEHAHVWNVGRVWRTFAFEKYPLPPFLLTDRVGYTAIHNGLVSLQPTDEVQQLMVGEIELNGRFEAPVLSPEWLGYLVVTPADTKSGRLLAFSDRISQLPAYTKDVRLPDENNQLLGTVMKFAGVMIQ